MTFSYPIRLFALLLPSFFYGDFLSGLYLTDHRMAVCLEFAEKLKSRGQRARC